MLIRDHINLVGTNPLMGENNDSLGTRFPDLTDVYSKELRAKVKTIASKIGIKLVEGVYAWWSGPAYETPAEINMIRVMGGDAVGMSTVPEAIVAAHSNIASYWNITTFKHGSRNDSRKTNTQRSVSNG